MAGNVVTSGTKVKTGCATCRIRKVKCDEKKPFCLKCVDTGRICDGYRSPFRILTSQSIGNTDDESIKLNTALRSLRPTTHGICSRDIDLLNRYFSTKTLFDVELGCDGEARQVLQASSTNWPVQHAYLSLKALREDLESTGDGPTAIARQTPSFCYGIQQYSKALGGLASSLTYPNSDGPRSALLCCHIFVSIEQVRKNYGAMVQHIIHGLGIMHEYRARPTLFAADRLMPAHRDQLPFLDVFIIKLFAAPCKFADSPETTDVGEATSSARSVSPWHKLVQNRNFRTIAPNMRTEITRIAALTLDFLGQVSRVKSLGVALQLLSQKAALLDSLESWLVDFKLFLKEVRQHGPEPISMSFLRLFHLILRIVLMGALDSSPNRRAELRTEHDRLQTVVNNASKIVRSYTTCIGTKLAR